MSINYVLIDFENVQPKNLELLKRQPFKIFMFVGENQNKVPFSLATAMHDFGEDAKYIKISGNGKNSLDFHMAYYIGQLSLKDPNGHFHIISKDTGFDPLIKHLRANKIRIERETNLSEIPMLRISKSINEDDAVEAVVKNLAGRGQSRPRKLKTLTNTINSLFKTRLDDNELDSLMTKLKEKKYIKIDQGKVTYKLPKQL